MKIIYPADKNVLYAGLKQTLIKAVLCSWNNMLLWMAFTFDPQICTQNKRGQSDLIKSCCSERNRIKEKHFVLRMMVLSFLQGYFRFRDFTKSEFEIEKL